MRPDISRINFSYALSELSFDVVGAAGGALDGTTGPMFCWRGVNFCFFAGTPPPPPPGGTAPPRRREVGKKAVFVQARLSFVENI